MPKQTFHISVTQLVEVKLDDKKFTAEFMEEFRAGFFPIFDLEGHASHIGQLYARGIIELGWKRTDFIEGYGHAHEMGISAEVIDTDIEVASI